MSAHLALFYRDVADLLGRVGALLAGAGRSVVLAGPDLARLADRALAHLDTVDNHTRPVAALAAYRRFTGDALVVTQPDPGDSPADWVRAARHEAALTFADSPHTVVCAYPAALPGPL